ncbi:MAG: hypothetical protein ACLSAH_05515 [Bilophila wadsworthia]
MGAEGTVQLLVTISADGRSVRAPRQGRLACSIQPPTARQLVGLDYPRSVERFSGSSCRCYSQRMRRSPCCPRRTERVRGPS